MRISPLMDEVGTILHTIPGLRVHSFWADRITPPAAVVQWPESYSYDLTMARGADRLTLPVTVLTGNVVARTSRDLISQYADGTGTHSVKAVLEAATYTECDSVRVQSVEFGVMTVAAVEYLTATFHIDIVGSGS